MRKVAFITLAVLLCVLTLSPACAEAPAESSTINLTFDKTGTVSSQRGSGIVVFTDITNNTTETVRLTESTADLLADDDQVIGKIELLRMYPETLEPGQTGYITGTNLFPLDGDPVKAVFHIKFTKAGFFKCVPLASENANIETPQDAYLDMNMPFVTAQITNTTDENLTGIEICYVIKEKETGALIELQTDHIYDSVIIPPHNSIIVKKNLFDTTINKNALDNYEVEAIAYQLFVEGINY